MSRFFLVISCGITLTTLLSGCAGAMRNYQSEMHQTLNVGYAGNIDSALSHHEQNNKSENKDLLYFLEKGELLTVKGAYDDALNARLQADEKIKIWEDESRLTTQKVATNVSSLIVNDKVKRYDGRDYEKVMLSTRLVSNRLVLGQWDDARVEVKKMHEREATIAESRAKEIEAVEKEANAKGINTTYKDLKGYPVEILDDPEVEKLKNAYENAYAHYLAGFMYESLGERGLAAAGYRKAIELRPNTRTLESALQDVDARYKSLDSDQSDVLIVYESGLAPSYKSISIPVPLPLGGSLGVTPISFPVIHEEPVDPLPSSLTIDGVSVEIKPVTDINLMARRALKDEMPGIITRSIVRATSKAIAQKAANDNDSSGVSGLVIMLGGFVMEGADERIWKTLPSTISLGRTLLKKGKHMVSIPLEGGAVIEREVDISNRYTVVQIRKFGQNLSLAQANSPQEIDQVALQALEQLRQAELASLKSRQLQVESRKLSPAPAVKKSNPAAKPVKKIIEKPKKLTI